MKTIHVYVVAETEEKAETLISGTYSKWGRPWTSTLSSRGAARLYKHDIDIERISTDPEVHIYPFTVTFEALRGKKS